jgi:hypothetical protein
MGTGADVAVVSCPYLSPSCPTIHTYSNTQQYSKIICVIPTFYSDRESGKWLD